MNVLIIMVPIAIALGIVFVTAFIVSMRSGQYDDLETPPRRILKEDKKMEGHS